MQHDQSAARAVLMAARQLRDEAEPRWRAAIVAARKAGLSAVEVAMLAGCSRQRVHQIEGKKSNPLDAGACRP